MAGPKASRKIESGNLPSAAPMILRSEAVPGVSLRKTEDPAGGVYFEIRAAKKSIGRALLTFRESAPIGCPQIPETLYTIRVSPQYQGRGIGKWVLDEVIKSAGEQGLEHLVLEVNPKNARAKHVYSTRGFVLLSAPLWSNIQGLQMMELDINRN